MQSSNTEARRENPSQDARCVAAGIAVTAGAITAAVLAIAGITGALTWGFLNQSEITGMAVLANAVTVMSGVISTQIFTMITLTGWEIAGEPMTKHCRERRGLSPMGKAVPGAETLRGQAGPSGPGRGRSRRSTGSGHPGDQHPGEQHEPRSHLGPVGTHPGNPRGGGNGNRHNGHHAPGRQPMTVNRPEETSALEKEKCRTPGGSTR